ncbi:RagB/SusD family nutrient uptake outer membrane protein [Tamlana fucoidanivorans]|nr:RagB/SusD family nutrient uptake outer membrane protein [Tamlana fucoidanivorans]
MKRYFNILLLLVVLASTYSCEDYLDQSPEDGLTSEQVFSDYFSTRGTLDRANRLIHNYVFNDSDWSSELNGMADDCQVSATRFPVHTVLNSGNWMDSNFREIGGMRSFNVNQEFNGNDIPIEIVGKAFIAIRAVNQVMKNIDLITEYPEGLGYTKVQLKNQLIGQAYFLRAFHYFQIIRRYGGFPIMDKVYDTTHDFNETRPTYLESTEFMVSDLDKAIELLPEQWNSQNLGRATKTSARALKAMSLLYAASPLMNPQLNPYGSNSKTYNIDLAKRAAQAGAEAINGLTAGGYEMFSMEDYTENWYSRNSGFPKEAIIQAPLSPNTDPNGSGRAGQGWFLAQFEGGWAVEGQPTQNAVDKFETISGYDINDPEAQTMGGYDPNNPYENRDPRFRRLIWVHGDDMYPDLPNPNPGAARTLNALPGGWHYNFENSRSKMFTGYYHRGKFKWPGCNKWHRSRGWFRMFPHIRVPQVYLDFAEAANEAYGPNGAVPGTSLTAVQAINVVRNRAEMPNVIAKYTADKETFKKRIYNERAVELFHEFHRWHDLRRWKLAQDVFAEGIWGADIKDVNGNIVYDKKIIQGAQRIFEHKHYWYPFPTDVMNIMTKFEQNPGW